MVKKSQFGSNARDTHIFTCAQNGAIPHWGFLKSLEQIASAYDAKIHIGVTNGKYPTSRRGKDGDDEEILNSYLRENTDILFKGLDLSGGKKSFKINSNLYARNFPVKAQQMIPLTSWDRFVKTGKSAIMFSPKMMMQCQANLNDLPKILMSTGAVTRPNYKDNAWGVKAELDHQYGAILVEVEDDKIFHFRQLVPNSVGVVYDLGVRFDGEKNPVQERISALIPGDWHLGLTDPEVRDITFKMIKKMQPKHSIFHDFFNNAAVSHHNDKDVIYQAMLAMFAKNGLDSEFFHARKELYAIKRHGHKDMKIVLPRGNHDEHSVRYLQEGRFSKDPRNLTFASNLLLEEMAGRNSLKEGICYRLAFLEEDIANPRNSRVEYKKDLSKVPGVIFLDKSDSYKIGGIECGCHGDLSASGTRGSIRSISKYLGVVSTGHPHTPGIFRDCWQVGTSTYLRLNYNKGPSSWLNTHQIINPNRKRQLVNIINGRYRPKYSRK